MGIKRSLVPFVVFGTAFLCSGQEIHIDTVYVFDSQINKIKTFHKVNTLSSADIQKNSSNLSEVLRFQSPVYIKENGRGAASSPSFRGTTAQQTAFVWNGININSGFLGQGDLNNTALSGYDQVEIKAGGGSVIYGSGAVGGSIHLNNDLNFNKGFKGTLRSEAASFGTFNNFAQASFSNDQLSFKFTGSHSVSENEYRVPESRNYINRNGQYFNTSFNFAAAYKIARRQQISWVSEFFNGNQHYPVFFESQTPTKYETQNIRSLISWDWSAVKFNNSFKAAYTEENFQYFGNISQPETSGGTGRNYILKNSFNYFFTSKINFNLITEFQVNQGEGYQSGLRNVSRNVGSLAGLLRYYPAKELRFEAGIKKDFVEDISSPLLFSFSGSWDVARGYNLGISASGNFRFPSFNDLYWQPGGNRNLNPETSYQLDVRNQFKTGNFTLSLTPYYIKIYDMISWRPSASGYFSAFNINNVESYGLESQMEYEKKTDKHSLKTTLGYSYTKSTDIETGRQLIYVPYHKIFGNISYSYRFLRFYLQGMMNGLTYTDSNGKAAEALQPYFVMNAGLSGTVMKNYTVGFKVNNIFDQIYETTAYYPLPKRNYSVSLNFNF